MPSSPDLFGRSVAVLAFLLALYTLAARERKTPYITNSIYPSLYLFMLTLLCYISSAALESTSKRASTLLLQAAYVCFGLSILLVAFRIWKLQNRHVHFRDDNLIRNLWVIRKIKSTWRSVRNKPTYEHHPATFSGDLIDSLASSPFLERAGVVDAFERRRRVYSPSFFVDVNSIADADKFIMDMASRFLANECLVQYTTCLRHPVEFANSLKACCTSANIEWRRATQSIVLVDAYTPHFGFTDSILAEATKDLVELGVTSISSAPTYAGVHTAAAKAFNALKKKNKDNQARQPTLVIYEGTYALSDLESLEQYRIFVRHVIPSERLWGGMLTVFLESAPPSEVQSLLKSYADYHVNLQPNDGSQD